MRAIVTRAASPGRLDLGEVDEPRPADGEAVVRVTAFSLNRGEVGRAQQAADGTPIGWDLAGVVEREAADGSGPSKGTRVVGFSAAKKAWAERCAVPTADVAPLPDGVSDEDAAALPVAALTALYCVERGTRLLGSRVLVTGATGGVGLFACQLAKLMGAIVVAQVRRDEQVAIARRAGADEILVDSSGEQVAGGGPYRLVVDGVGGPLLSAACGQLYEGCKAIVYGLTGGNTAEVPLGRLLMSGDAAVEGFNLYDERGKEPATRGLVRLARLVADGKLDPFIQQRGDWSEVGATAADLLARRFHGKAVLQVSG